MTFSVSPRLSVAVGRIGAEQEPIVRIDDVLEDPAALVDFAAAQPAFAPAGHAAGGYPGVSAPAPLDYVERLVRAVSPTVERAFGLDAVKLSRCDCRLALMTTPPDRLTVQQRTPHIDTAYPLQFAFLHYLCDARFGGTFFYRHRATGFETLNEERAERYDEIRARELAAAIPPAAYPAGDNDRYLRIGACEAKFNRLVIYRSCLLHSGHVPPGAELSADPRRGRLTANIFVNYRPA